MVRNLALSALGLILCFTVAAQETLPGFSASLKPNGKIIISWRNNYTVVTQISIQRSNDSLKNFTTLLSVPDPSVSENGFVDSKAPNKNMFYRLFIVLENGKYLFTKSKKAIADAPVAEEKIIEEPDDNLSKAEKSRLSYLQKNNNISSVNAPDKIGNAPAIKLNKIFFLKKQDTLIGQLFENSMRKFRDSILHKTKDTLVFREGDTVWIKPFVPKEVYKVSSFVFSNKDGNIMIVLPEAGKKKYGVRFLEADATELFEIKDIKEPTLIVDKTNFIHSGWFRFELYEDGKLKEKNKLFIPKEF
ncbi:MAG TPA: hypothetical protein VMT76_18065 [Puia sp.]|nr:hypothetical protein [Puia sp.]